MNSSYHALDYAQVSAAAALVILNAVASVALLLNLEGSRRMPSVRTVVQRAVIGVVLKWVFAVSSWPLVLALMTAMTLIAGASAVRRTEYRFPGVYLGSIVSVWASSWIITAFALFVVLERRADWYAPQYSIPLLGMILGNTLNGISLGLDRLGEELSGHRDQVEALLTLGATRWEAARPWVRQAVRTGMIPMINSMMVVGIVSLPGMMTGQLLSGVDPVQAVKYQIVIMFLVAAGSTLGTLSVVLLSYQQLFNSRHQFVYSRLRHKSK